MVATSQQQSNLISLSKSGSPNPNQHRHFYTLKISSMAHLAEVMLHRTWSPIVWKDGVRLKDNFLEASYAALDFDDGRLTINDALKLCEISGTAFVLGTSKSHQKEKTTPQGKTLPAVDRFRLVFKMKSATTNKDVYEYTMKELMDLYTCDPSCKDAARFFYGCKEIVAAREGIELDWSKPPKDQLQGEALTKYMHEKYQSYTKGTIPMWVQSALRFGRGEGQRHKTCYMIGATLIHCGFTEKEIIAMCAKSPLSDIGLHEIERAVLNGAERSKREHDDYLAGQEKKQ